MFGLRKRLEFSKAENKEFDMLENIFPSAEIYIDVKSRTIYIEDDTAKIESYKKKIDNLEKIGYTLQTIHPSIADSNHTIFVLDRGYSLPSNKIGNFIIYQFDLLKRKLKN